ncbi:erythromycin esterase family protein [Streptomyces sp. NPDC006339]|uniref:erythromycin esterase family protein n=1 Tax=Streptomyces sp. NPDC006339 TaxID=3156755 RepID=UPI0033AE15DA
MDGLRGLSEFGAALAGVRLVGLGESTHGTAEFFRLKHRLVEYLVTEHGFRTFAMEASASAAPAVDAYVRGRGGAAEGAAVLAGLGFWTWRTREVLDLLEWLRAYNRGRAPAEQVGFAGIDPQRCGASVAHFGDRAGALAVLAEAHPGALPERRAELTQAARALADGLSAPEDVRHARILTRAADVVTRPRPDVFGVRDGYMADAVDELLAATDAGIALWAHNGHVAVREGGMGGRLRERHGSAYYALGLFFGEGAFRARRMWPGPWGPRTKRPSPVAVNRVGPPPPGSLEALLADRGEHVRDLRGAEEPWHRESLGSRSYGAYVARLVYRRNVMPTVPGEEYDGLAYVPVSTPSVPLRVRPRGSRGAA